MKRLTTIGLAFIIFFAGIVFGAAQRAFANAPLPQPAPATVSPEPEPLTCFIGPVRYDLVQNIPPTPTRIVITATPLPETVTPRPTATLTATAAVAACRMYTTKDALKVRGAPSLDGVVLRILAKGEDVLLSTKAVDKVTVNGVTWQRLCAEAAYVSAAWVQVSP